MENHRTLLYIITAILLCGCQGKQGDPGPSGQNGTNGTSGTNGTNGSNGANGTNGTNGTNAGIINGAFKGIVAGKLQDGTAFSDSIDFPYATGYEYISTNGIVNLHRSQFPIAYDAGMTTLSSSLGMDITISNLGTANQSISYFNCSLVFYKPLSGNQLLGILCGGNNLNAISNLVYNTSTALLTFNFSVNASENSNPYPISISGTFSGLVYVLKS